MKTMYLFASISACDSDNKIDLEISESDWNKLSDQDQTKLINEYLPNIVQIWTEPRKEE